MISKEEAIKASKMSLSELEQEYPKISMLLEYTRKHYPDDWEKFTNIKMYQALMFTDEYSNTEIESMIDKIALFNGFKKWSEDE